MTVVKMVAAVTASMVAAADGGLVTTMAEAAAAETKNRQHDRLEARLRKGRDCAEPTGILATRGWACASPSVVSAATS